MPTISDLWHCFQPLSSSEALELKYKGGIATLAINEVFPEDEGEYTCKATNTMGTAETTCKLTVKRKSPLYASLGVVLTQFTVKICRHLTTKIWTTFSSEKK